MVDDRPHFRLLFAGFLLSTVPFGCSSSANTGHSTPNNVIATGGSSSSGGSTSSGISGSPANLITDPSGGSSSVAGSAGTTAIDPNAACGIGTAGASLAALNMFIMFDDSKSMDKNDKWTKATGALKTFFADPAAAGLSVAFRLFPNDAPVTGCDDSDCSIDACASPLIPLAALKRDPAPADTQEAALVAALGGQPADGGGTPLYAALGGAEKAAGDYQAAHADGKSVVVLVTDGSPNGCTEDIDQIAALAADARTAHGILTYAIGLEGSNETDMDTIATAGGTTKGIFIGDSTNANSDLLMALSTIRGTNTACDFAMPTPTGTDAIDPEKINVNFTPGGGTQTTFAQVATKDACATTDAWYYDTPGAPTRIFLCPHACDTVRADENSKLQILLGCATQTEVPR